MPSRALDASLFLFFSLPASALNWAFLQYSPVTRFTDQDWGLLGQDAEEGGANGEIER